MKSFKSPPASIQQNGSSDGLELKDIEFSQGEFRLNADLHLPEGELACLLGPSGSGKTTILRLIGGFEKPSSGTIHIGRREITSIPPEGRKLGIVFQDYALFPHMTVAENITYGVKASGLWKDRSRGERNEKKRQRTSELLDLVRLPGFEDRKIASLSGGEQQRVALARALAPEPDLLLLDEPLSALDVQLRTALRREIKRIQKTLGLTTLYITHDQEEALALADKIFIMQEGKIVESGEPENLYANPAHLFTGRFLGVSNTISLKKRGTEKTGTEEAGKEVLFFRPEDCELVEQKENTDNLTFQGRIVDSEYRGSVRFLLLERMGDEIRLFVPPETIVTPGDDFSFRIKPGRGKRFTVPQAVSNMP